MKYQSAPIPVKLFVKRFFENNNLIKQYVYDAIYPLFTSTLGLDKDVQIHDYQHSITIPIPDRIYNKQGPRLTRQGVAIVNSILEGYIKDRFECELEANIRRSRRDQCKFHIQEMIIELRKIYNLSEDDLPFETIKKSLQRYCDKYNVDYQELKKFNRNVPSPLTKTAIPCHIKAIVFRKKLKMPERTFFRLKEKNKIRCEKLGGTLYININDLPDWLKLRFELVSNS